MGFWEEANELRAATRKTEQAQQRHSQDTSRRLIATIFAHVTDEYYAKMRHEALETLRTKGQLERLRTSIEWQLDWSVTTCDTAIIAEHLRHCGKTAFLRLVDEMGAANRLVSYYQNRAWGHGFDVPNGYLVSCRVTDFHLESGDSYAANNPYKFQLNLTSRFTPPLP